MVQRLAEVQPIGCTQRHQTHISQTRQAPEYLLQRTDADQHWRRHDPSLTECSSAAPPLKRAHSPIPAQQSTLIPGTCPDIPRYCCAGTLQGDVCQISRAYSAMVRSEEKNPLPAVDMMDISVHLAWSRYVSSTRACASALRIDSRPGSGYACQSRRGHADPTTNIFQLYMHAFERTPCNAALCRCSHRAPQTARVP